MIERLYNKTTHQIIWENVWCIPEFNVLLTTNQSAKWHKEGFVGTHTRMVVHAMDEMIPYDGTNGEYRMIMMLSALFHDIGKGETTFFNREKSDWSARNHAEVGETITRRLLWNENPFIRESICYFVRNHMKPLYVAESPTGIRDIITMSCDTIYPKYCTFENLIKLKTCDNLGAMFDENDEWVEKLEFAKSLAHEIGCLNKPYAFPNEMTKYVYFNESADTYPMESKDTPKFDAYIIIGGASRFENIVAPHCAFILDDGEGDVVDQIIECCEDNTNFVLHLNTLPQKSWDSLLSMIYVYHGKIVFVYGSEQLENYLSPNLSMETINAN